MRFSTENPRRESYHHGNLREALMEAALRLIAERGPAGFAFAEVARAAGVSPAAPYRHFRDRNALIAEIACQGYERFADELERAWADGQPDPMRAIDMASVSTTAECKAAPPLRRSFARANIQRS